MSVSVTSVTYRVAELEMRMPFHFGNVAVSECPHVFVELTVEFEERRQSGTSMGGLIPMWFYKNPEMGLESGFKNMVDVFVAAGEFAKEIDSAPTVFEFWTRLWEAQKRWAATTDHPPLLWSYGVSMVEQAGTLSESTSAKYTTS